MRVRAVLVAALAVCLSGPPGAAADVHGELDRRNEVRLTLDGRVLTAELAPQRNVVREPEPAEEVFGRRVRGVCGASFNRSRPRFVHRVRRWPRGAGSLRFEFRRDISRRVRWCLIETPGGGDIAFVSFVDREPARLVAKGRTPSGQWWRLAAWRGEQLEPCLLARFANDAVSQCLHDEADREARLATVVYVPRCPGDTFVFGATGRSAAAVAVETSDGTVVEAEVYRRPRGSRARARYFAVVLPGTDVVVRQVRALDRAGRLVGRQRYDLPSATSCEPVFVPD